MCYTDLLRVPAFFLLMLFLSCGSGEENEPVKSDLDEVLSQSQEALADISSIEYQATYKIKFFTEPDTSKVSGKCYLQRVKGDTLMGGKVWVEDENGYDRIYTVDQAYYLDRNDKTALVDDPSVNGIETLDGNIAFDLFFEPFLGGFNINLLEEDSVTISLIQEEESGEHFVIGFRYPDFGDFTDGFKKIWINKQSYLPEKVIYHVYWGEMVQFVELRITEMVINEPGVEDRFADFEIPEDYAIEFYAPTSVGDYETLGQGVQAPDFAFSDTKGNNYRLSEQKGKLVLLDFWYRSCYPCIKALPHLEELHQKYKDAGLVVWGIDSKEKEEQDVDLLQELMDENGLTYPTLLVEHSVDSSYNVRAYPTMYLLDQEGKVLFSQVGFGENTHLVLDSIIKASF
jgi:peroxiredoxin/outer membrane lipoprotein-sorting protein